VALAVHCSGLPHDESEAVAAQATTWRHRPPPATISRTAPAVSAPTWKHEHRMSSSLSELGDEMVEVTAMHESLAIAAPFAAFFFACFLVVLAIPSLWADVYAFSAYLIELVSIAALTASLFFLCADCRIAYYHVNELCAQASYQKLSSEQIARARRRIAARSRQHLRANNLVAALAVAHVVWFVFRVFFTHWSKRISVVVWIPIYFKELIYLLLACREISRVNDRSAQLQGILAQRMWHGGDLASNVLRLSMFAMLANEPLSFVVAGRRWSRSDLAVAWSAVVMLSLLVVVRSVLMQFSLTLMH
jgi:hypothetical protein